MKINNPFLDVYTTLELLNQRVAMRNENKELVECARCGVDVDPTVHPQIGCDV